MSSIARSTLGVILTLFAALSVLGIDWGLPTRAIDRYLFGDGPVWSGAKIYSLAGADERFSAVRGADVDVDPLARSTAKPIRLTASEQDLARIYLRYRLYTYQPDEMITMMALAGMDPRKLDLDPRLYQYGGLFLYPVGALIAAGDVMGLIDVRSDVVHYLDNPDEFGKFYVIARAFAAAWGLIAVLIVFAIARRLGGPRVGLIAALLFTLMPVVVCMAHEGKPHLPGATLMLLAVLLAMRHLEARTASTNGPGHPEMPRRTQNGDLVAISPTKSRRDWWLMCVCCGAAFGMVLSSWPIFVLIPLVALLDWRRTARGPRCITDDLIGQTGQVSAAAESRDPALPDAADPKGSHGRKPAARSHVARGFTAAVWHTIAGGLAGVAVYLLVNPYILINLFVNRAVLRSNFGNSLAMYQISRIGEGFKDVLALTIEGATLPILLLGVTALIAAILRKKMMSIPLVVSAAVFFLQFVLIGADKPAEYGRFGVFANSALAIGTACLLGRRWHPNRDLINAIPAIVVTAWVGLGGFAYLANFRMDAVLDGSRIRLARLAQEPSAANAASAFHDLAVFGEPAPYCCPPLDFSTTDVRLYRSYEQLEREEPGRPGLLLYPIDRRGRWASTVAAESSRATTLDRANQAESPSFWARETPISWANKPFFVTAGADVPDQPPPPASDWLR